MNALMARVGWRWAAACLTGIALTFVQSLDPVWAVAFVAPVPVLVALLSARSNWEALGLASLAAFVGQGAIAWYYFSGFEQFQVPPAILALLVASFTLPGVVPVAALLFAWRLAARELRHWLLPFVFPVIAAAVDLLFAAVSPNGTLGSWAYSQMQALPVIQTVALGGTPAVVFLVSLVASTLAVALTFGTKLSRPRLAYGLPVAVVLAGLAFGMARLAQEPNPPTVSVALAATNTIEREVRTPGLRTDAVPYLAAIEHLPPHEGDIVVLPEVIETLDGGGIEAARQRLSLWARESKVWLLVGVNVGANGHRENRAWVFDRNGVQRADYLKQYLIPLINRKFMPGHDFALVDIDGAVFGIAICKDLDFAALARAYALRGARVLLVPALDLGIDRDWHARMAMLRGVEHGMSIVRSADDGLMSVSDMYGHVLAERPSGEGTVATLVARAPIGAGPTFYTRIGDLFGWLCVAMSVFAVGGRAVLRRGTAERADDGTTTRSGQTH